MSIILGITGTLAEGYWTSPLYLYNNGTWSNLQTTGVTVSSNGGFTSSNCSTYKAGIITTSSPSGTTTSYIGVSIDGRTSSATQSGLVCIRLNQTVNLGSYNYLKAENFYIYGYRTAVTGYLGVSTSSTLSSASFSASFSKSGSSTTSAVTPFSGTVIVNVSSLTGNYYIYICGLLDKSAISYNDNDMIVRCKTLFLSTS